MFSRDVLVAHKPNIVTHRISSCAYGPPMNLFLYLLTVLIWGTTWIAMKQQLGVVPIAWSVAYRFALAALVLFT
jgi:hypothetical protein